MAKKKISVNGEKELIEKLNSKIKTIKSDEKPETAATPDIKEPDTEPEAVSTEKNVITSENNEPDWKRWDKIESGLQRRLKFDTYKDKGYADAYTNTHDIKKYHKVIDPKMVEYLKEIKRTNENLNTALRDSLEDNAFCRITIDKEMGMPVFDECGQVVDNVTISDEYKKVLDASRKISDKIKNIKNASNKKTMSNGIESVINDILSPKKDLTTNEYEMVDHPQHYNNYEYEVIDMMRKIYGDEKTAIFCELNAFKYRMRMGTKPTSPIQEDLKKEQWYLKKKKEILNK